MASLQETVDHLRSCGHNELADTLILTSLSNTVKDAEETMDILADVDFESLSDVDDGDLIVEDRETRRKREAQEDEDLFWEMWLSSDDNVS